MNSKKQTNPEIDFGFHIVLPRIIRTGEAYKHLSPTQLWLYANLKDLCGDHGMCYRSLRTLAEETHISIGMLSESIRALHDCHLVHAEKKKRTTGGKEVWHISIVDIWQENAKAHPTKRSHSEQTTENKNVHATNVHTVNNNRQVCSPAEQECSHSETEVIPLSNNNIEAITRENVAAASADIDPLLALLEKFRNGDTEEQAATLQVLRDAGLLGNDSHLPTSTNQFPTTNVENPPTSLQEADSSTPSETTAIVPEKPENTPIAFETGNSTPLPKKASQVAKSQASGEIRIAAKTTKPARNTRKPQEKSAKEPKPTKPAEPKKNAHHPDLGKWYGMFNETYRELGKKDGIPANFAIPSHAQYTKAFEAMIEAGATLEQGKWTLTSIWNDPDPFWRDKRTPTAMASQYLARISRMPRNLHIVPTPDPVVSEPVDPEKPVERWTRILDQKEILKLSLEDRKDYFVWRNAQRKVS